MKKILLLIFLAITLLSCEKDDELLLDSNLVKSIENQVQTGAQAKNIIVKYDDLDRVYSINDTVYYYNANNQVTHSKYIKLQNVDGLDLENVILKSYQWDKQNRLESIRVDSVYQKVVKTNKIVKSDFLPFVEASFFYSEGNLLPDSIVYRDGLGDSDLKYKKLYHSNGNISKIEEGVVSEMNSLSVFKSVFMDYADQDNYLYPLYSKLGFLPKNLGYVASKKMLFTAEIVESIVLSSQNGLLNTKRTTIKNTYSSNKASNGYPTVINVNSMIDFDNGEGYSNAGTVSTYVQY